MPMRGGCEATQGTLVFSAFALVEAGTLAQSGLTGPRLEGAVVRPDNSRRACKLWRLRGEWLSVQSGSLTHAQEKTAASWLAGPRRSLLHTPCPPSPAALCPLNLLPTPSASLVSRRRCCCCALPLPSSSAVDAPRGAPELDVLTNVCPGGRQGLGALET